MLKNTSFRGLPPKQIFRQSPSPSLLKGIDRDYVRLYPSKPCGIITPHRRLCMDARPTKTASLHIPLWVALPLPTNSDTNTRHAKVSPPSHWCTIHYNYWIIKQSMRHVWVFLPKLTHVGVLSKSVRCRFLNLRGPPRPSRWSVTTPCVGTPDNPLHHFLTFPRIIRAVNGIQNVLWRARLQTSAIVAGLRFSLLENHDQINKQSTDLC
jgi:hypothetical protein